MDKKDFEQLDESWETLKSCDKAVYIYGIGNACERILKELEKRQIKCSGIFSSDDFVAKKSFCGFEVKTLSQLESEHEDFAVCMAFGSSLPDVMERISSLSKRHTLIFPDLAIAGNESFTKSGFLDRWEQAKTARSMLCDERSREIFDLAAAFKISGDISFLERAFSVNSFEKIIEPNENDIYADLGAYNGDTALEFLRMAGGCKKIYAFEPDKRSFRKCVKRLINVDETVFVNACAWNCDDLTSFSQSGGRMSKAQSGSEKVSARSLDSVLNKKECSVIKYDVEGAEKRALLGSKETIERFHPRLAVSVYHRPFDFIDLTMLVHSFNQDYKLYLRQPPYFPSWDLCLYAV